MRLGNNYAFKHGLCLKNPVRHTTVIFNFQGEFITMIQTMRVLTCNVSIRCMPTITMHKLVTVTQGRTRVGSRVELIKANMFKATLFAKHVINMSVSFIRVTRVPMRIRLLFSNDCSKQCSWFLSIRRRKYQDHALPKRFRISKFTIVTCLRRRITVRARIASMNRDRLL